MSLSDFIWAYGPLLGEAALGLVVIVVLSAVFGRKANASTVAILAVIMVAGFALLVGGLYGAVMGALRKGVYATAEVLSGSGISTRIRVNVNGRDTEAGMRSRFSYRPGTRLDVMVDPASTKVLLVLGRPMT